MSFQLPTIAQILKWPFNFMSTSQINTPLASITVAIAASNGLSGSVVVHVLSATELDVHVTIAGTCTSTGVFWLLGGAGGGEIYDGLDAVGFNTAGILASKYPISNGVSASPDSIGGYLDVTASTGWRLYALDTEVFTANKTVFRVVAPVVVGPA